jgi:hypothetical protein
MTFLAGVAARLMAFLRSEPLLSTAAGITSLVAAVLTLLPDFGVHLSPDLVRGITGAGAIAALLVGRRMVTPAAAAAERVQAALYQTPPDTAPAATDH